MALLDILVYPDPRLRRLADNVVDFNDELQLFVANMAETMYFAPGIGLAATQVNDLRRIICVDVSPEGNDLGVYINPEIIEKDGSQTYEEGCLSIPGVFAEVERFEHIKIRAQDTTGNSFDKEAHGLLAVCIQHEIDHLDGKVFVDYLSRLKQDRVRKRMIKEHGMEAIHYDEKAVAESSL